MEIDIKNKKIEFIAVFYLINSLVEVISEYYSCKEVIYITKPLIPSILMVLYYHNSHKKNIFFFVVMIFSLITNLLFIPNSEKSLFYGVISFTIHRIFLLVLIFKIVKIKDYIAFSLAAVPVGFVFFYLFQASDIPENSYYLIIFHNIMAIILGGIGISNYAMNDTKQNSLLLISVLLFLGLQLVIYVEKYYLSESHSLIMRPLAMTLNVLSFYSFYRFVISSEKLNDN